jgi:hypothetical protein
MSIVPSKAGGIAKKNSHHLFLIVFIGLISQFRVAIVGYLLNIIFNEHEIFHLEIIKRKKLLHEIPKARAALACPSQYNGQIRT